MIIAIAGQKGGSGKSTLAVHLAAEWARAGSRVLLVDADPQGTALTWSEVAAELGHPTPDTISVGENLRLTVPSLARGYDVTVIDVPGRMQSKRQVGALMVADVAVLPCGPSTPDVWALAETLDLVDEVRRLRPALKATIVLNRLGRTTESRVVSDALRALPVPLAATRLRQRVAFSEALAAGLGVTVDRPRSAAAREVRALARELEGLHALDLRDAGEAHVA